jgi:hypothetical protein
MHGRSSSSARCRQPREGTGSAHAPPAEGAAAVRQKEGEPGSAAKAAAAAAGGNSAALPGLGREGSGRPPGEGYVAGPGLAAAVAVVVVWGWGVKMEA